MKMASDHWSCAPFKTCITNSLFRTKPQHKVSWRHPRSKHWHQLDLILVRRAEIKNVLHTRSYHSADCDRDRFLVCCKTRIQRHSTRQRQRGSLVSMSARCLNQTSRSSLLRPFRRNLDPGNLVTLPQRSWKLCVILYGTALATFGKRSSKLHDWFEAKSTVMTPIIEAKRAAIAEYKRAPSERNLQILRIARSKAQQTARCCTNEYWTELTRLSSPPP